MCEPGEDKKRQVGDLMAVFCEHTCGAIDARDCNAMKHMILAEIRKSNAPSWVAQELEKKLSCRGCWNAMVGRSALLHLCEMASDSNAARDCPSLAGCRR